MALTEPSLHREDTMPYSQSHVVTIDSKNIMLHFSQKVQYRVQTRGQIKVFNLTSNLQMFGHYVISTKNYTQPRITHT